MRTIFECIPTESDLSISNFVYQIELTEKLDKLDSDFNQDIINEIVLWKVNRYSRLDAIALNLINRISKSDSLIDKSLTKEILLILLAKNQKGIRLAMATTILRFKNPQIYQILDQRVYRFLYGKELNYPESDINQQIQIYLDYLEKLKVVCSTHKIKFEHADRILYNMDKFYNSDLKLKGY